MENLIINNTSPITLVDQIVNSLIAQIEQGKLKSNERLLSINQMSRKYAIARDTAEKAYIKLKVGGYIWSVAGKGYFVSNK